MFINHSKFEEKFSETIKAVFPILAIVLVLCFTITPIGERVGSIMTLSKNVLILVAISFIMGMVITI